MNCDDPSTWTLKYIVTNRTIFTALYSNRKTQKRISELRQATLFRSQQQDINLQINFFHMSKSCSFFIRANGLTPSGQAISGDISEGYLAWPSSPAQSKSISLTQTSFVIMTFGGRRSPNTNPHSCNSSRHQKQPIYRFFRHFCFATTNVSPSTYSMTTM